MSGGATRLYLPRPAAVSAEGARPVALAGVRVDSIREQWVVEEGWWTERPVRRRYFELALVDGRCEVVFCERGAWYRQRGA